MVPTSYRVHCWCGERLASVWRPLCTSTANFSCTSPALRARRRRRPSFVFEMHPEVFDRGEALVRSAPRLFRFPLLRYTHTVEESKALARQPQVVASVTTPNVPSLPTKRPSRS